MEALEGCMSCLICGDKNLSSKCPGNNDLSSAAEALNKFLKQLGVPDHESSPEVRLCGGCLSGVARATQWGEQVEEIAQDVKSRQEIILKRMGQLKSLEGNYLKEMTELERKIRKSQENIAELKESGSEDERGRMEGTGFDTIQDEDTLNQGTLDGILAVMEPRDNDVSVPAASSLELNYALSITDNPNFLQLSLFQEIGSCSFEEDSLLMAENFVQDQNPLFTENVEVEHLLCWEVLPEDGSISMVEEEVVTHSSNNAVDLPLVAVTEASTSLVSGPKTKKETREPVDRKFGPCQFCGKKYATKYLLQAHVKMHTGELPYKCPMCSMAFVYKYKLKGHMVIHGEEKPFTCSQCNRGFKRKSGLTSHQKIHSDEKPFPCPVCEQRFKDKRYVKAHCKRKHPSNSAAQK